MILWLFVQPPAEAGIHTLKLYFLSEFRLNLCSHFILWHSCHKIHYHQQTEDFFQIMTHRKLLSRIKQNRRANSLWRVWDSDISGWQYDLICHMLVEQRLCWKLVCMASGKEWHVVKVMTVCEEFLPGLTCQRKPACLPFTRGRGAGKVKYICIAETSTLSIS